MRSVCVIYDIRWICDQRKRQSRQVWKIRIKENYDHQGSRAQVKQRFGSEK